MRARRSWDTRHTRSAAVIPGLHRALDALSSAAALEELHGAFMLLGRGACAKGAQIPPLSRLGILLARIEPIAAVLELSNHRDLAPHVPDSVHVRWSSGDPPRVERGHPCQSGGYDHGEPETRAVRPTPATARRDRRSASRSQTRNGPRVDDWLLSPGMTRATVMVSSREARLAERCTSAPQSALDIR